MRLRLNRSSLTRFPLLFLLCLAAGLPLLAAEEVVPFKLLVSVKEQKLVLLEYGIPRAIYPISTSKYGLGDRHGSMRTPLGLMRIAQKIGGNAPLGAVFKSRKRTGEILPVNAPGRDPIVTRILWLEGLEPRNANTFRRMIYIHGTPEEKRIGKPVSYGCIRMKSSDVVQLYNSIPQGTLVKIQEDPLPWKYRWTSRKPVPEKYLAANGQKTRPDESVSESEGSTRRAPVRKGSQALDRERIDRVRQRLDRRDAAMRERLDGPEAEEDEEPSSAFDKSFLDL